jgi:hypothetical protein
VRGQTWCEYRHWEDDSPTEASDVCVSVHHLAVGQDFRTSDLEDLTERRFTTEDTNQVLEHIFDGDWLTAGLGDPPRDDHYWQNFN